MMLSNLVIIVLTTILHNQAYGAGVPSPSAVSKTGNTDDASKNTVALNNFDHKIGSLIESISRMENSIQNLQEKSHTWSIFQHHIESWNDGLRILENKLDILKRSHEEQQGQLNQLELTLSMTHDTPPIMDEIKDILKRDRGIQMETTTKVNAVLRQLQNLQKDLQKEKNSTASTSHALHGKKKGNIIISSQDLVPPASSSLFCNSTHKIEQRLSTIAHQMVHQKDLKQLHSVEKRMAKSLEGLTQSITQALDRQEELTTRLQKSNECCYSLSSELTTFTESSDILLKRIERLINNVNEKLTKLEQNHEEIEENNKENSDEDEQEQDSTNPHSDLFSDEIEGNETSKEETEIDNGEDDMSYGIEESRTELFEVDVEFLRPDLSGCHELLMQVDDDDDDDETNRIDGIYKFLTPEINEIERDFNERHCVFPPENNTGLPWTVIQQRVPYHDQENFNRSWVDYRNGFGQLNRDFWFGNEFIHRLVYHEDYELRVELEDFNGTKAWAEYGIFRIDAESFNYNLLIDEYRSESSNAGDALAYHNDNDFSTYDRRNDKTIDACCPCAMGYGSGWWFDNCSEANLNGIYHFTPLGHNYNGIMWELWHGDYSLKRTRMMIRPRRQYSKGSTIINSSYDETNDGHREDP